MKLGESISNIGIHVPWRYAPINCALARVPSVMEFLGAEKQKIMNITALKASSLINIRGVVIVCLEWVHLHPWFLRKIILHQQFWMKIILILRISIHGFKGEVKIYTHTLEFLLIPLHMQGSVRAG